MHQWLQIIMYSHLFLAYIASKATTHVGMPVNHVTIPCWFLVGLRYGPEGRVLYPLHPFDFVRNPFQ